MDPTTTLQQVLAWPVEDQLAFVFSLWDKLIDAGVEPALTG